VRLLSDAGFEVVAEAADAPDVLRKVAAHKPDVAIVDVQTPPENTDDGLPPSSEASASRTARGSSESRSITRPTVAARKKRERISPSRNAAGTKAKDARKRICSGLSAAEPSAFATPVAMPSEPMIAPSSNTGSRPRRWTGPACRQRRRSSTVVPTMAASPISDR
jgi:hypothetical protein